MRDDADSRSTRHASRPVFRLIPQLTVEDVGRSVTFYRERLGFAVALLDPPEAPVFALLERESAEIYFVSLASRSKPYQVEDLARNKRGVGVRLYMQVNDARAVYDQLRAAGVPMLRVIANNEAEHYDEFSFEDPDGYEIGVFSFQA